MATLKAGTYTIKAVPTVAGSVVSAEFDYKTYIVGGNNSYSTSTALWKYISSGETSNDTSKTEIVGMRSNTTSLVFLQKSYEAERGWYQWWHNDGDISSRYTATDTTKLRTIIVETDQTVNDAFYAWFMANIEVSRISVDLATAFPDKWAALAPGEHTIQIRAKNPGNYLDSDLSTAITFYKTVPITVTATNCTAAASNPTVFPDVGGGDTILTFNKKTGYTLPETIVITGVAGLGTGYTWTVASDGQSAQLKILKALGAITVKVEGVVETYNITTNLTHATKESGPSTIAYGASATLKFAFPTGYEAPTDVTVTGATKSWAAGSGTLTLTNATGPVTVTVVGVATTTTIAGQYKWHDEINLTEWSQDVNFTSDGTSYNAMRYTGDGTAMTLQYKDADSEWNTVYNYDEDTSTGSWVNDAYKIVDFGTSAQTVTAIWKADFLANASELTQLATPQNVSADGTIVSWDEVENATSYDIYASTDSGTEVIGTVTTGYTVSGTSDLVNSGCVWYSIDNGNNWIDMLTLVQNNAFSISNVKTIKFKVDRDSGGDNHVGVTSDELNLSIDVFPDETTKYSDNYTLTHNIDDIYVYSSAV